jgi:hypothetical protein
LTFQKNNPLLRLVKEDLNKFLGSHVAAQNDVIEARLDALNSNYLELKISSGVLSHWYSKLFSFRKLLKARSRVKAGTFILLAVEYNKASNISLQPILLSL